MRFRPCLGRGKDRRNADSTGSKTHDDCPVHGGPALRTGILFPLEADRGMGVLLMLGHRVTLLYLWQVWDAHGVLKHMSHFLFILLNGQCHTYSLTHTDTYGLATSTP